MSKKLEMHLKKMKVSDLKKEISKQNIKGYSKLTKENIISIMLKYPQRFMYLLPKSDNEKKDEFGVKASDIKTVKRTVTNPQGKMPQRAPKSKGKKLLPRDKAVKRLTDLIREYLRYPSKELEKEIEKTENLYSDEDDPIRNDVAGNIYDRYIDTVNDIYLQKEKIQLFEKNKLKKKFTKEQLENFKKKIIEFRKQFPPGPTMIEKFNKNKKQNLKIINDIKNDERIKIMPNNIREPFFNKIEALLE